MKGPASGAKGATKGSAKSTPQGPKAPAGGVPPKKIPALPTDVPLDENSLLVVLSKQTTLDTGVAGVVGEFIEAQGDLGLTFVGFAQTGPDWDNIFKTLAKSELLQSIPIVSTILNDVLGPLGDAQGMAKAVLSIASSLLEMHMQAKANDVKCQKLGRQLGDVEPALRYLLEALNKKTSAIMQVTPAPSAAQLAQFKRETESLTKPLQTLQVTAKAVQATITEWIAKGQRLFGAMRKMFTSKNFAEMFEEHSMDIANGMMALQTALSTMTFLNVNELQEHHLKVENFPVPDKVAMKKEIQVADKQDEANMAKKLQALIENDKEFREELKANWVDLEANMNSHFSNLTTVIVDKFDEMHMKLDIIGKKLDEVMKLNRNGSSPLLGVVDAQSVLDRIHKVTKVVRGFKDPDAVKVKTTEVLRGIPEVLNRCIEPLERIAQMDLRNSAASMVLKHFVEDLDASYILLLKWQTKSARFDTRGGTTFFNTTRMSRLQDLMNGFRDFQDKLMQLLMHNGADLSEARKGSFSQYDMVQDRKARDFWVKGFPGRAEVPLAEFTNMMRWQPFLSSMGDLTRTRALYWLKIFLDENNDKYIHIGEWNQFSKSEDYEQRILQLARRRVPDEDEVDLEGVKLEVDDKQGGFRSPGLSSRVERVDRSLGVQFADSFSRSQDHRNPLIRMPSQYSVSDLEMIGVLSINSVSGVNFVDVAFVIDCTHTMKTSVDALRGMLPLLGEKLNQVHPGALVRVALVGYRDDIDDVPLVVYAFGGIKYVQKFIETSCEAKGGGGDAAEDAFAGLERASRLDWTFGGDAVRHVVMMADAPCHGTRYHDFEHYDKEPYSWKKRPDKWDRYPTRDADGKQGRALMQAFSSRAINFTFVQLNRYTEKMTGVFKEWYDADKAKGSPFRVVQGLGELMSALLGIEKR